LLFSHVDVISCSVRFKPLIMRHR